MGESGATATQAQEEAAIRALKVYRAEVVATQQLTPQMRRITLGNGDLAEFTSIAPDEFVYVFLPRPGIAGAPVERDFTWDAWRDMPEDQRAVGRYYTVRRHDPVGHRIELDVVLHGDGPGATWGATTVPGDVVAIWGPRMGYEPPADTEWLLLVADQTGLPATAAIIESLAPGMRARAVIEVPDAAEEQVIESAGDVEVLWLHGGRHAAGTSELLMDAVRSLELPGGIGYAWGAGENRAMVQLRKHLTQQRGMQSSRVSVLGYWHHQDHDEEET